MLIYFSLSTLKPKTIFSRLLRPLSQARTNDTEINVLEAYNKGQSERQNNIARFLLDEQTFAARFPILPRLIKMFTRAVWKLESVG